MYKYFIKNKQMDKKVVNCYSMAVYHGYPRATDPALHPSTQSDAAMYKTHGALHKKNIV